MHFLANQWFPKLFNKNIEILDEVKLREDYTVPEMFAIMLEQEDGTYSESNSSAWPTDMVYNEEMSGCIDSNGKKLEGILSYNSTTQVATVEVGETAYCYLYFEKEPNLYKVCKSFENINECVTNNSSGIATISDIWDSTLEDDGYRYVGTNPNNYVCFGTTDKATCTSDTDKYMYRIIGIFEDESGNQHLKLIKKEALNSSKAWNSNYTTNIPWEQSDLYKGINGSYFLSDTTNYPYMGDASWTNKITSWNYTATNTKTDENYSANGVYGPSYYYTSVRAIYLHELHKDTTGQTCYCSPGITADCSVGEWTPVSAKIGLMYASDYALSLGELVLSYATANNSSVLKTGWVHLSNNDSSTLSTTGTNPPSSYEWTMSRFGARSNGNYTAWSAAAYGAVDWSAVNNARSVRPVFYLESNVKLSSGDGTSTNPFILENEA